MILSIKHKDKDLFISHVDADCQYALATYEQTKTKLFKVDLSTLELSKDQLSNIKKQLKHQF